MKNIPNKLDALFKPRSIAVVGASTRPGSVGRALVTNLMWSEFDGEIYAVNPKRKEVMGLETVARVRDLPEGIDLALVCVPAVHVPDVITACGDRKVQCAAILSSGFRETGREGERLEETICTLARRGGVTLLGPNCLGVINSSSEVKLNATFGDICPGPGSISFISQSGAVGSSALEYMLEKNIGVAKFVSVGNKGGINENDVLNYLQDDEDTDIILLYLEDLADPRRFMDLTRSMVHSPVRSRPILAVKAGGTAGGARAARSHTGALAAEDDVIDSFFTQSRVIRLHTLREMLDSAVTLTRLNLPKGRRMVVVTNAGGLGTVAADALEREGLSLAVLGAETRAKISALLPAVPAANPVDVLGDATPARFESVLRAVCSDGDNDGILAVWAPTLMSSSSDMLRSLASAVENCPKPVIPCFPGVHNLEELHITLDVAGLPLFRFAEEAVRSLSVMARARELTLKPDGLVTRYPDLRTDRVWELIELARSRTPVYLTEAESLEILESCGIPVLPYKFARNLQEAGLAASDLGYPVTIKVVSPDILFKGDHGGVRTGIMDDASLTKAFLNMMASVRQSRPYAKVRGVIVQSCPSGGIELFLGMKRDPRFGPLIAFGLGGDRVEVLKDLSFRLAPLNSHSLASLVRETGAGTLLRGYRGTPRSDIRKIQELVARLSQLAVEVEEIEEIDVNPLLALPGGPGAAAVGARIILGGESEGSRSPRWSGARPASIVV